jgi:REP element-mobilizing transposase RayT
MLPKIPSVKKQLWGGEFWSDGYFVSTVGEHGNENIIGNYVKNQGKEYQKLHEDYQIKLF